MGTEVQIKACRRLSRQLRFSVGTFALRWSSGLSSGSLASKWRGSQVGQRMMHESPRARRNVAAMEQLLAYLLNNRASKIQEF